MENTDVALELSRIAKMLADVADKIGPIEGIEDPVAPQEAWDRNAKGLCLSCENPAGKRGLCDACYQRSLRAIESGETTDAELVRMGLRLPVAKPGKKPKDVTRLDQFLAQKNRQVAAVNALAGHQRVAETSGQSSGQEPKNGGSKSKKKV